MVQWATHIGAKVIACVSTKEKAEQAKADGAQHIVLYSDKNLVERVKEITNGAGVSVVYDSVGKDTFQESLECLAIRGSFVSFGQSSGPLDPIPISALASKSLFLTRPSLFHYTVTREDLEEVSGAVLANVASGVLKIRVNHTYPLSQVAQAHADIEARKTSGSIVLIPDGVKKV
jgi:NADPH2:quinone reductase